MDDLVSEFLEETNDSLDILDQDLVDMEKNPDNPEIIGNIFRVMHTIKGTCGFIGLERLASIAHSAENIMDKIRDQAIEVTPEVVSLILEAIDRIKSIIEVLEETGTEPAGEDSDLINRLNACAEHGTAGGEAPAAEVIEEESAKLKTPDLDEEIDFDPIPAPGAELSDAPSEPIDIPELKTPDLDEEIDFDPIPAPGADMGNAELVAQEEPKTTLTEQEKQQAVKEGLAADEAGSPKSGGSSSSAGSIRVNLDVLDDLMQMVSELVLTRNQLVQVNREFEHPAFKQPLQRLNLITTGLQEGVMKTRMQPIGGAWAKYPRLIRDLSKELGKKIELVMDGADTELDRQLLEMVKDPLTHMVRNSVDHGLETPDERTAAGKKETGTVWLSAYHEGGHIVVKIEDDGKGIDVEKVKEKALQNGLTTDEELSAMADAQIFQFIFKPGFSTAEKVTAVSGRGVGMDVVSSNIAQIGGTVELDSTLGRGTTFLIKIPLTLAILPVLIVEAANQTFAIPQIRVSEIIRAPLKADSIRELELEHCIETINGNPVLRLRGRLLPIISLAESLQMPTPAEQEPQAMGKKHLPYIVICEVGSETYGLMVDKVFHTEEIVVKPAAKVLKDVEAYAGCTILGDGSVIMIIDPNGILSVAGAKGVREEAPEEEEAVQTYEDVTTFLTFSAWGRTPKAISLELVNRLEEIDAKNIEWAGNSRVVQYRGKQMRLIMPEAGLEFPEGQETLEVLVFSDRDKVLGMVVESITDIVKADMQISPVPDAKNLLGTIVIEGKVTELIDVSYYFTQNFDDWLHKPDVGDGEESWNTKGERTKVLLVDDSPFFRKFMKPVLLAAEMDLVIAEDGLEALTMLNDGLQVDAVISDIDMPNMNGLEFIQKAKADPRFANTPFIALTTHTAEDLHGAPGFDQFVGHVPKSERDRLVPEIQKVLKRVISNIEYAEAV